VSIRGQYHPFAPLDPITIALQKNIAYALRSLTSGIAMKRNYYSGPAVPICVSLTILGINLSLHLGLLAVQAFFLERTDLVWDFFKFSLGTGLATALLGLFMRFYRFYMNRRAARATYWFGILLSLLLAVLSSILILFIDPGSLQVAFLAIVSGVFVLIGLLIKLNNNDHAF